MTRLPRRRARLSVNSLRGLRTGKWRVERRLGLRLLSAKLARVGVGVGCMRRVWLDLPPRTYPALD
jgi:hypothetical protein